MSVTSMHGWLVEQVVDIRVAGRFRVGKEGARGGNTAFGFQASFSGTIAAPTLTCSAT